MNFRTTTLTATLAMLLGAGTAFAQEETIITVPLDGTASAPAAGDGFTFTATPETDGTEAVAAPVGTPPQSGTATLLSPSETVAEGEAEASPTEAPVDQAATVEPAEADPVAQADVVETDEAAADEALADTASEPAAATTPVTDAAATDDAALATTVTDPAASAEGDVVAETGASEGPVEAQIDAAADVEDGDAALEAIEAENQLARTAGEVVAENTEEAPEAAPAHVTHITDVAFPFEGPFGRYDQFQLQRGLQVYTEVCASCHGMRYVPLRTLSDSSGPGLPEDQVRAYAAGMDITDAETGEDRPRLATDNFPHVAGEGMGPDLSLMAKARAGFHGPYGTGISQFFNGIGGPEYIYSVLTGYTEETKDEAGSTFYENAAFPGGWIQMPPPLSDDLVTYADGHPATAENMAEDVSAFLMWAAEPHMMARKQAGLVSVMFLIVLTVLLYLTNKRLWTPFKHRRDR